MSTFLFYLSLVFLIIAGSFFLWMVFFILYGLFMKKKIYPETTGCLRFAIIICARNEEKVVGNLIDSLKKQDYPSNCFHIFTVAHNCTDQTVQVAASSGSRVLVRDCPEETHKGDALNFALTSIRENEPGTYDAFVVFDADNLVSSSFLTEINKAFATGADVVQGFRATKNYDDNLLSRLFGAMWMSMCYSQNLPHTACHLPVTISGTGFAAKFSALDENGWHTGTLCEDIEFSIQQMLLGHQSIATENAVFYDEQPTRIKPALRQRLRWAVGINQCFNRYFIKILTAIPKRGIHAVKMAVDILLNPALVLGAVGLVIQGILLMNHGIPAVVIITGCILLILIVWMLCLSMPIHVFIRQKMSFAENLGMIILFPFFLLFSGILAFIAPFCPQNSWKPIEHDSTKTLEDLEG